MPAIGCLSYRKWGHPICALWSGGDRALKPSECSRRTPMRRTTCSGVFCIGKMSSVNPPLRYSHSGGVNHSLAHPLTHLGFYFLDGCLEVRGIAHRAFGRAEVLLQEDYIDATQHLFTVVNRHGNGGHLGLLLPFAVVGGLLRLRTLANICSTRTRLRANWAYSPWPASIRPSICWRSSALQKRIGTSSA